MGMWLHLLHAAYSEVVKGALYKTWQVRAPWKQYLKMQRQRLYSSTLRLQSTNIKACTYMQRGWRTFNDCNFTRAQSKSNWYLYSDKTACHREQGKACVCVLSWNPPQQSKFLA